MVTSLGAINLAIFGASLDYVGNFYKVPYLHLRQSNNLLYKLQLVHLRINTNTKFCYYIIVWNGWFDGSPGVLVYLAVLPRFDWIELCTTIIHSYVEWERESTIEPIFAIIRVLAKKKKWKSCLVMSDHWLHSLVMLHL